VVSILDTEGLAGLDRLSGIGKSSAAAIRELIETGHLRMLARLEGAVSPAERADWAFTRRLHG
jgi:DNA polymerase/3'-5' exonuclease PolX